MHSFVRFILLHFATGFGIAALFVGALLLADPGGIGGLLLSAREGAWPALLLWLFTGLTFGAVQFGAALMLLEETPPRRPARGLQPVPARVPARRR
ncbi:hypothetical protein [Crenalkalicoccus roseus]|uniref:hypothetical protein n=1 Tax=Crenalkalicoccus roseus TaxID=1485588 RepID=UPI0010802E00|nr:hypothetical protein [Crenalkalicoccus roseus]